MKFTLCIVLSALLAASSAYPTQFADVEVSDPLVPFEELSWIDDKSELIHSESPTLVRHTRQNHQLDANAFAQRTPGGQQQFGGGVGYTGPNTGANINAQHTKGFGTDLNANANANLWRSNNGRSSLDGGANYQQHFGGPGGRQKPNYGGNVNFSHRW